MNIFRKPLLILLVFTLYSLGAAQAGAPPAPRSHSAPDSTLAQRLQPGDLRYLGAFAFPPGDEWTYSGHALAYYPPGDPSGLDDGHPGSLYTVGHAWTQHVGQISIPAPVTGTAYADLPKATVLQPLADITGGWLGNCTYAPECIYREVAGLEWLPQPGKLAWNLRDWYNVAGHDQDSVGWSNPDSSQPAGVWHIGSRGDGVFHNARTSDYLFTAPDSFASTYLSGRSLIAGNHRQAGAFGGSQGPTLYALAPWQDGNPPGSGSELTAQALLYYPENIDCTNNNFGACAFTGYRVSDTWGGGAWIESGGRSAVLIFGRKGLGNNCYGIPGEDCPASLCSTDKGWHSDPYEGQILFYDPGELAAVVQGNREPWRVQPYAVQRPAAQMFNPNCGVFAAVAYDAQRGLIYVTESNAGEYGATAVHVWQVEVSTPAPQGVYLPLIRGGNGQ